MKEKWRDENNRWHTLETKYYMKGDKQYEQHIVDGKVTCDRPVVPKRNEEDLIRAGYLKGKIK